MISISLAVQYHSDQYHQTTLLGAHFCSYRCVPININKHAEIGYYNNYLFSIQAIQ